MRVHEEPITIEWGLVGAIEGPTAFRWRGHRWAVEVIEARAVLTAPWWDSPAARAVRSGGVDPDPGADLLGEQERWRVAARRRSSVARGVDPALAERSGVFDLGHDTVTGAWQLLRALD